MLDDIAQSLDEAERTAEPVSENLANVVNKSWLHKLSDDQLKAKVEKYHRPANCGKVVVPKVNEEIWSKLPRTARGKNLKFSRLQTNLTKVGHIAVKSTDALLDLKAQVDSTFAGKFNELVVMTTDAIALLGHASIELSQLRREDIKVIPQYCIAHLYCARFSRHQRAHMSACSCKTWRICPDIELCRMKKWL